MVMDLSLTKVHECLISLSSSKAQKDQVNFLMTAHSLTQCKNALHWEDFSPVNKVIPVQSTMQYFFNLLVSYKSRDRPPYVHIYILG